MPEPVLVGDIGGTNVRLALAHLNGSASPELSDISILAGDDFHDFADALQRYLETLADDPPAQALFAFAGPIKGNTVQLTNRDWLIDRRALEDRLGFRRVHLVNDYAAMARSIPELPAQCFKQLHEGLSLAERAPILVAGPGTGLGMATLLPKGKSGWSVLTGEGGHTAFAPATEREWALAENLRKTYGFVANELVVAGMGLTAVHRALCEIDGVAWEEMPPAQMLALAKAGDPICRDICSIRAAVTLSAIGDAALINGARGGAVITGGVAERLVDWLERPEAIDRFFKRGPREDYMRAIPIRLLLSGEAALIGAAALFYDQEGDG